LTRFGKPELGRLERVDLRTAWASEPYDFTPWLAEQENIALLGDAIGMDLDVEAVERHVGSYKADIVCRDTTTNRRVVIENQLEATDHCHLGQSILYAAGLEAVAIVWIARQFTEEHRAAMDWLNNSTREGIDFFGLEIELWRIGSSPMAPKFNIVSKPNDWTRTTRPPDVSEGEQSHLQFWTQFARHLEEAGSPIRMGRASKQAIGRVLLGSSPLSLIPWRLLRDDRLGVWVRFKSNPTQWFEAVEQQYKERVEEELRLIGTVGWDEPSSTIEVSPTAKPATEAMNAWLQQALEQTHAVFNAIVDDLRQNGFPISIEYPLSPGSDGSPFADDRPVD
jgi:hypothetical protein